MNVPYHRVPILGFAGILSGAGWAAITGQLEGKRASSRRWLVSGFFCLFLVGTMITSVNPKTIEFVFHHSFRSFEKAYLTENAWTLGDQRQTAEFSPAGSSLERPLNISAGILFFLTFYR